MQFLCRKNCAHTPSQSVAYNGISHRTPYGVANSRVPRIQRRRNAQRKCRASKPLCACECGELLAASQRGDHAESLERPFRRRDFKTARPARLLMRSRKPWVLLRLRLLGWNVRFTSASWRVNFCDCAATPAPARWHGALDRRMLLSQTAALAIARPTNPRSCRLPCG